MTEKDDNPKQSKLVAFEKHQNEIVSSVAIPVNLETLPLYDLYAGFALMGLMSTGQTVMPKTAEDAFRQADLMIAERNKRLEAQAKAAAEAKKK